MVWLLGENHEVLFQVPELLNPLELLVGPHELEKLERLVSGFGQETGERC